VRRRNVFVWLAALAVPARPWAMAAAERARIDQLIGLIASQKQARFIRNGSAYSGREAAAFLRRKFDKIGEHVGTAQQFIDQIASSSSTTGQPYLLQLADGRTMPVAELLREELRRMDRND
jgi:hypothetical protein